MVAHWAAGRRSLVTSVLMRFNNSFSSLHAAWSEDGRGCRPEHHPRVEGGTAKTVVEFAVRDAQGDGWVAHVNDEVGRHGNQRTYPIFGAGG